MTRGHVAVAAIAIAGVAACVGLIAYAGTRMYESIGPSKAAAAADGSLYLVSHGKLHVFGKDRKRRESVELGALGVTLKPSDIAVHRDGRIVIASPDGSDIHRCTLATRSCERIEPRLTRIPLQHALPLNSVKIAIDEERARYFLSDNAGHRVVETDLAGQAIARTKPGTFTFPNQLALEPGNVLRVVDTNHQRIALLDASGDSLDRVVGQMSTEAQGVARPGREWPFDALRTPAGETWALIAVDGMKDADLVVFDAAGKAMKRIDLGDDSDPFDIELWGDRVIVSDAINYRVHGVSLDGAVGPAFDDPAFDAELERARDIPGLWRAARIAAQVGIGLVPLIAIVVLRHQGAPMGLKLAADPVAAPPPGPAPKLGNEVRWIEVSPPYFEAVQRRALRGLIPTLLIFAVVFGWTWFTFRTDFAVHPGSMLRLGAVAAFMLLSMAILPFTGRLTRRALKGYRIGASIAGLHYEMPKAQSGIGVVRTGRAPWRDVYYDGKRFLAGRKLLMAASPRGDAMFEAEVLRTTILAHLPRANFVSPGRLAWLTFAAYGPIAWIVLFLFLVMASFAMWRAYL